LSRLEFWLQIAKDNCRTSIKIKEFSILNSASVAIPAFCFSLFLLFDKTQDEVISSIALFLSENYPMTFSTILAIFFDYRNTLIEDVFLIAKHLAKVYTANRIAFPSVHLITEI
jgi:hypothetical protein